MADESQPPDENPPPGASPTSNALDAGDIGDISNSDTAVGTPSDQPLEPPRVMDSRDLTGQTLADRYTVLKRIGSGGMSVVYLARHDLLKKIVAVKVLRADQSLRKDAKTRFHREAKAAASIADPHIVDITDYGFTQRGDAFIVMERLEGLNLRELVLTGPVPAGRAVGITRQILHGLVSAHGQGIIHRDLKAENVFVCQHDGKDYIKLLDFGISKVTQPLDGEDETGLTTTGQVLGTPQYLAPEQAHGIEHVDHRADLYAMGVILYEMLTGELPFTGKSVFEVVMKHVQDLPEPPRKRRPDLDIPADLERVVLRALEKDPDARYQSAQAMLEDLPGSSDLPGGYTSQSLTPVPRPAPRSRIKLMPLLVAALLVVAGVMAFTMLRSPPSKHRPRHTSTRQHHTRQIASPDVNPRVDAAQQVTLQIQAMPPKAQIQVDGKTLGTGHGSISVLPGTKVTVDVHAPGYRPHTQALTVQHATVMPIQLVPTSRPPKHPAKAGDLKQNPYH